MAESNINVRELLLEIFSNKPINQIEDIMTTVRTNETDSPLEEQFESMINLLSETDDSTIVYDEDDLEGAMGTNRTVTDKEINYLSTLFPNICPNFLMEFCDKFGGNFNIDLAIDQLTDMDYIKIERDPKDIWQDLKEMLPNADPGYLKKQAKLLVKRPDYELQEFIQKSIEKPDYPTMRDYLVKVEKTEEIAKYTNNFNVNQFLDDIPNPFDVFIKSVLTKPNVEETDIQFALDFLYNTFTYLRKRDINNVFQNKKRDLIQVFDKLKKLPKAFRVPRRPVIVENTCKNVALLQEIAFLKNRKIIKSILKMKSEMYYTALAQAEQLGLLQTCQCCFDETVLPEECYFCDNCCIFCKDCVKSGAENVIAKGELKFPCLIDCGAEFNFCTLQMVLNRKVFQRLFQRRQMEEIKQANIEGLETCPFCDFSMIPMEGDKIFKCANEECKIESCRLCRHKSHIPMKCNEIEYDEDVRIRTYIENKMSDALLRQCWQCSKKFYKESGCNKMTCYCGAVMCYVCGQAVKGYDHFRSNICPLYTENLDKYHLDRVINAANQAKTELGVNVDPNKLKFDPAQSLIMS